ncbi:toxin glutamine deamidase domain-containing protein [Micromonospora sp. RB23]
MPDIVEADCIEFASTWVPSGQWLSLDGGPVPDAVYDTRALPGLHQVHIDPAAIDAAHIAATLSNQPLDVIASMVHVPSALEAGLDAVAARADHLGLPVLVRSPASVELTGPRVVPFEMHEDPGAVLVLPTEHLADVLSRAGGTDADLRTLLPQVNPWHGEGGDFTTNCVLSAIGVDISLREGGAFQVPPSEAMPAEYLVNYAGRPMATVPDLAFVTTLMTSAPQGSRGILLVGSPAEVSHAFNVVRDRNGLAFLDGTRGVEVDPAEFDGAHLRFVATTDGVLDGPLDPALDQGHEGLAGMYGGYGHGGQYGGHHVGQHNPRPVRTHNAALAARMQAEQAALQTQLAAMPNLDEVGRRIFEAVQRALPYGAANQAEDYSRSGGEVDRRLRIARAGLAPTLSQLATIAARAAAARAVRAGNCDEHAAVSFADANKRVHKHLASLPAGTQIAHVMVPGHVFVVIGVPGRLDLQVVVDPWQKDAAVTRATQFNFPLTTPPATYFWHKPDGSDLVKWATDSRLVDPSVFQDHMDLGRDGVSMDQAFAERSGFMYDHRMNPQPPTQAPAAYGAAPMPPGYGAVPAPPGYGAVPATAYGHAPPAPATYGTTAFGGHAAPAAYGTSTYGGHSTTNPYASASMYGPPTVPPAPGGHHAYGHAGPSTYGGHYYADMDTTGGTQEMFAVEAPSDLSADAVADAYPFLRRVNPNLPEDSLVSGNPFTDNCVIATFATDLSLASGDAHQASGVDVPQVPTDRSGLPAIHLANWQTQQLGLPDGEYRAYSMGDLEAIRDVMRNAPDGSRGIVLVRGLNTPAAHSFNVVRDRHGVNFLDGQRHGLARVPETLVAVAFLPLTHGIEVPDSYSTITLPERADSEVSDTGVPATAAGPGQEHAGEPVEALAPPTWSLRPPTGVTTHGDVHVISSDGRAVPQRFVDHLASQADADHPVIVLNAPRPDKSALATDVATLNYLLEQFAQRAQLPVVVSRGKAHGDLLDVAARYGATVLEPTLARAGGLGIQLDQHQWKAISPRQEEGRVDAANASEDVWPEITAGVLGAATRMARPTEAVTRVDDAFGELIWARDLEASREVFQRLAEQWSPERMKAGLEQVNQMKARVPDQPALSVFAPVLEFGAVGQAGIVFDYASAQPELRPKVLLNAVGQLDAEGKLNRPGPVEGGVTTERLAAMVGDVGVTDITKSVLHVLGQIKAHEFDSAQGFIDANKGKLTTEQKGQWVDAIAGLVQTMEGHADQLRQLSEGVLQC